MRSARSSMCGFSLSRFVPSVKSD